MPRPVPVAVTISAERLAIPPPSPPRPSAPQSPAPRTPSPGRPAAASLAAAAAGADAWRWQLARGDAVDIRSATAGGWVTGRVMKMDRERLKVEYVAARELCDKVVMRSSSDLRPAGTMVPARSAAASSSAPATEPAVQPPSSVSPTATSPAAAAARPLGVASPTPSTQASATATPARQLAVASPAPSPSAVAAAAPARPQVMASPTPALSTPASATATPARPLAVASPAAYPSAVATATPRPLVAAMVSSPPPPVVGTGTPGRPSPPAVLATPASSPATPVQVVRQVGGARPLSRAPSRGPQRRWVEVEVASPAITPAQTPKRSNRSVSPSSASTRCLRFSSGEWLKVADLQMGELLGSGGFGTVHKGRLHGEDVAIKRLHLADGQISPEHLAEFQKEVGNLQALRHPRLIRFVGVALELPVMCIVTELAPGGSLYALLHVQRMPLSEVHRRTLVLQICEGVAFLHGRRPPCVHRDLKSANVVLDAELNAKLCDFGLAETMDKTHISRRDSEAGSPRYMAPEVFDARSKLTEKLDIWALGCLVVEVLIDQVPHEDCSTIQQVAAKLLVKNLGPFEDEWADGLRPEVRQLVGACFAREASRRPAAAALLEGLRRLEGLALPRPAGGPRAAALGATPGTPTVPPNMLLGHYAR